MELNFNPTYNKHPQLLIKFLLKKCVIHKTILYFWSIKLLFDLIIYFIYKSEIEIKHELILMTFDHWFTCFSFFLDINTLAYFLCVKLCIMTLFKECLDESCMIFFVSQVFKLQKIAPSLHGLSLPEDLEVRGALERVLRLPSVASKRYLTNKVRKLYAFFLSLISEMFYLLAILWTI